MRENVVVSGDGDVVAFLVGQHQQVRAERDVRRLVELDGIPSQNP